MDSISLKFTNPWLLFAFVPVIVLSLIIFFVAGKRRKKTVGRIFSLSLHVLISAMVVMVLAGLTVHTQKYKVRTDVVIVVDVSDSNSESIQKMNEYIGDFLESENSGRRIGIVTFAGECVYASTLNANAAQTFENYLACTEKPAASATDISSAMTYSATLLTEPENGRIILISDGMQTDGDAMEAAKSIAKSGIKVDAVYFKAATNENELQINSLQLPQNVEVGEEFELNVTVQSRTETTCSLIVYDNGTQLLKKSVELKEGVNSFSIDCKLLTTQLHELRVALKSDKDGIFQNNEYYAYVDLSGSSRILLIDGTGSDSYQMQSMLSSQYILEKKTPQTVPMDVLELLKYREIILLNVNAGDFPQGFDEILQDYVYNYGGGLLTGGGYESYFFGEMADTLYESMLPINVTREDKKSLAVMLVIDASSSMNQGVSGTSKTRLDLAKEGAVESVKALTNVDYAGVITFSATSQVLLSPTPATRRDEIIDAINAITYQRGTSYYQAVQNAMSELQNFDKADKKHVIFLSDGTPTDSGYDVLVERMRERGITLSSIAAGDGLDANILRNMAEKGGGRFYQVSDVNRLPEIMKTEMSVSQGDYLNEGNYEVFINSYSTEVSNLTSVPNLKGYIGASVKESATTVLKTQDNDPIYAKWSYGRGKVGSFTSDLRGWWSEDYFKLASGQTFIKNVVSYLQSDEEELSDIDVETTVFNQKLQFDIKTSQTENSSVSVEVIDKASSFIPITITGAAENGYKGEFKCDVAGVYTIMVYKKSSVDGRILSYKTLRVVKPYSSEYNAFFADYKNYETLEKICIETGGRILLPGDNMLDKEAELEEKDINPQMIILASAIGLFIAGLAIKKLGKREKNKFK